MIKTIKNLMLSINDESPETKLIQVFYDIKNTNEKFILQVNEKTHYFFEKLDIDNKIEDLWMKHYSDQLKVKNINAHLDFIKEVEKMENTFRNNNMEEDATSSNLIKLYLLCKIPNYNKLISKQLSAEIFEHFRRTGEINFTPPPKHRHLFLDNLN